MVLADTETHGNLERIANALTSADGFKEAGDETTIVFASAGTKWVAGPSNPDHRLHDAFESVKDTVAGACSYCAGNLGVKEEVDKSDVPLLEEYAGHPRLRRLVSRGQQVITF